MSPLLGGYLLLTAALDVRWASPNDCPVPELTEFTQGTNGVAIVRVDPLPKAGWEAVVTFREPFQATRRLELRTCAEAKSAARALLVLGLGGPDQFLGELPPPPADPPPPPPPLDEPPAARVLPAVRLGALAEVFALPRATGRLRVAGAVRFSTFEAELSARVGWPNAFTGLEYAPTPAASIEVWPVGADVAACWSPAFGRITLRTCGTLVFEVWNFGSQGVPETRRGAGTLMSTGALAGVRARVVGSLEVGVDAALLAALIRPVARLDGIQALTTRPWGLHLGGWAGWTF